MIGTPLLGAVVAHLAFWVLLALGLAHGDFGKGRAAALVGLWIIGFAGLPRHFLRSSLTGTGLPGILARANS